MSLIGIGQPISVYTIQQYQIGVNILIVVVEGLKLPLFILVKKLPVYMTELMDTGSWSIPKFVEFDYLV